ncbi:MAG: hypothetical protein ACRDVM_03440 [Acidimicrobiia bacterium]
MVDPGLRYIEHLTERDLEVLLEATDPAEASRLLQDDPGLIDRLLSSQDVFDRVYRSDGVSPFLVFGLLVHRAAAELDRMDYVPEWVAPRRRLPVFNVAPLRDLLADRSRRLFLAELLASFTRVASDSYLVRTRRGMRRRRFSELDPFHLIEIAEAAPAATRPGVHRRLGDVALFLTGCLPDHTGSRRFTFPEMERLAGAVSLDAGSLLALVAGVEEPGRSLALLEIAGARWYRMAHQAAYEMSGAGPPQLAVVADRFHEARRVLNYLADRHLYPFEQDWLLPA